jgi:hypothetical protein
LPGYDPTTMDTFANMIAGGGFSILSLCVDGVLYAIFGAIGGLIGTALIWKAPTLPPAQPPMQPPMQPQ